MMLISDFVKISKISAKNYLDIAQKSTISLDIINITKLQYNTENYSCRIRLATPMKYPDSARVMLKINICSVFFFDTHNKILKPKYAVLYKYNATTNEIFVRFSPEIIHELTNLTGTEDLENVLYNSISIVSDLRFLIDNVLKWYESFGMLIHTPCAPDVKDFYFLPEASDKQREAVATMLTNNVSYIWGAPGTGKTRIVLTSAILTYIKDKKRILVVAPTNNSVEQTLRAVYDVMEKSGEDTSCLLRMGVPSSQFASDFPDLCEVRDITAQKEKIEKLIDEANDKLVEIRKYHEYSNLLETVSSLSSELDFNNNEVILHKEYEKELIDTINVLNNKIQINSSLGRNSSDRLNRLMKSKDSFFIIFRSKNYKKSLNESIKTETAILQKYSDDISEIEETLKLKKIELSECRALTTKAKSHIIEVEEKLKSISISYFSKNLSFDELISQIKQMIHISPESEDTVIQTLQTLEVELNGLNTKFIEQTKSKFVFAFTADYFYQHYAELEKSGIIGKELKHIFVDEAAYLSIIKTGILFSCGVPVSFLGDHKQLPPVCPISDNDLKNTSNFLFLWDQSALFFPQIFSNDFSLPELCQQYAQAAPPPLDIMNFSFLPCSFRFGDNLAKIIDKWVYKSNLYGFQKEDTGLSVLDVPHTASFSINQSEDEANAILDLVKKQRFGDCAVLTPFNKQKDLIQNKIRGKCDVLTIHKSQGLEWDTVIISMVYDHPHDYISENLINTAISRAKKQIIIVCDKFSWINKQSFVTDMIIQGKNYTPLERI